MVDWSNPDYARAALADPRLPAAELAAIAAVQPGLWPQVATHPAAYPDLLAWLAAQGVPVPPRQPAPQQPQAMPMAAPQPAPYGHPIPAQQPPVQEAAPEWSPEDRTEELPLTRASEETAVLSQPEPTRPLPAAGPAEPQEWPDAMRPEPGQGQPGFAPMQPPMAGFGPAGPAPFQPSGHPPNQPMPPQGMPSAPFAPSGYPAMAPGPAPAQTAPPVRGRRRGLVMIIAAVVLVLGGGAGVWALTQSGGSDSWRPTNVRTVPPGTPADVGR